MQMTLDEFVTQLHRDVDDFRSTWLEERQIDPDQWPLEMDEGDWADQFAAHISV